VTHGQRLLPVAAGALDVEAEAPQTGAGNPAAQP
jgi:hypothetical protein